MGRGERAEVVVLALFSLHMRMRNFSSAPASEFSMLVAGQRGFGGMGVNIIPPLSSLRFQKETHFDQEKAKWGIIGGALFFPACLRLLLESYKSSPYINRFSGLININQAEGC